MGLFTIDGRAFDVAVVSLKQNFEVLDGPNAGRTMDARMHRDVLGTFYNYTIEVDLSQLNREDADALFDIVSSPADSHVCTFPHGQGTLTQDMYISKGSRELLRQYNGKNYWQALTWNYIAMAPARTP